MLLILLLVRVVVACCIDDAVATNLKVLLLIRSPDRSSASNRDGDSFQQGRKE